MKTILVPTDFSKHADWALRLAATVAAKANAKILLLHVVEHPGSNSFNVEGQISVDAGWEDKLYTLKLIERARQQLAQLTQNFPQGNIEIKTLLRMGNPFHAISTEVTEKGADLVVMGATGESDLDQLTYGSITDKAIRLLKCPVLTVSEDPGDKPFGNIVYATAMEEREQNFGFVVKRIQELFGATVHLVRVNTLADFRPDREVRPLMQKFTDKLKLAKYTLNTPGDLDAETGISHFATHVSANLICMATHGYRGIRLLLSGSVAENVIRHTRKPVFTWVMRDEAFEQPG